MEVFYINLERRTDRRDRFLAVNANLATFRRAEAADSKLLTTEPVPIPGLRRALPNFGIDVTMNQYYRDLNAYVCFPPLVWTENDKMSSDISVTDTMRDPDK